MDEKVFSFEHPLMGTVRGLRSSSSQRFLGIHYAQISHKLDVPKPIDYDKNEPIDGTTVGPATPSFSGGLQMEFSFIQKDLPGTAPPQSDTDCLNLNITSPLTASPDSKLPVIAFLHGGGFAIGSNAWPQYDLQKFAKVGTDFGSPFIGVTINYRLGPFGFLTSQELVDHGYKPNRGLLDQRTALLWIQKYISGFGGDPNRLTLIGESAGAVSITLHLQSETPLFQRAVLMGGTDLLMKPLPDFVTEGAYQKIVKRLGLDDLSPSERVEALVQMESEKVLQNVLPSDPLMPSIGSELSLVAHTYEEIYQGVQGPLKLPGRNWCKQIMVGDCQMDAQIMSSAIQHHPDEAIVKVFRESLTKSLGEERAKLIIGLYGIDKASADEAKRNILNFANDVVFFRPVLNYAHCWQGDAFIYFFNEPNTWEGPWKGFATHILDIAYLFQNFNDHLTPAQRNVAIQFATDVITFANGDAPFPPFGFKMTELYSRVYGGSRPEDSGTVTTVNGPSPRTERRSILFDIVDKVSGDELSDAWTAFLAGH